MKGNIGHGCVSGIPSVLHLGGAPQSLINKGMFNQAQVKRKGLQIGLVSGPGLVPSVSWPGYCLLQLALGEW